jgi:hypothetical protein
MTSIERITQALQAYLQQIDSGEDPTHLVTLFTGSPTSPFAEVIADNANLFEQYHIEVQAVFADGDVQALPQFADKLGAGKREGAGSVRYVKARRYGSYNEQLVLGSSSFVSGLTIDEVIRGVALETVDASDSKKEVAVATFAFSLLWQAATAAPSQNSPASGNVARAAVIVGSLASLTGKFFQFANRSLWRQQWTT